MWSAYAAGGSPWSKDDKFGNSTLNDLKQTHLKVSKREKDITLVGFEILDGKSIYYVMFKRPPIWNKLQSLCVDGFFGSENLNWWNETCVTKSEIIACSHEIQLDKKWGPFHEISYLWIDKNCWARRIKHAEQLLGWPKTFEHAQSWLQTHEEWWASPERLIFRDRP